MNDILIILLVFFALTIGYIIGKLLAKHNFESEIPDIRTEAILRSRSVLGGQFSEQLAPFLPNFPYLPTEVRLYEANKLSE